MACGPTLTREGNLGKAIITNLLSQEPEEALFTRFIACVRRVSSKDTLEQRYAEHRDKLSVRVGDNVNAANEADVILVAVDPPEVAEVLQAEGFYAAAKGKLLVSVAAGWPWDKLLSTFKAGIPEGETIQMPHIIRTLPNIGALVSNGLTAIAEPKETPDEEQKKNIDLTDQMFRSIGKTVHIPEKLMNATTAVAGSTPAMFAIICDALIDASVAVGVPRDMAGQMIVQSMTGTAALLQSGLSPSQLRDQGTSSEGCTIAGVMVMEENAVRGHMGRALREAVTVARNMGVKEHPNDTWS